MERNWDIYRLIVLIYTQVTRKEIQFSFSVEQDAPVSNIKPASVQLYDYYATGKNVT
jgi:hypothetical protein